MQKTAKGRPLSMPVKLFGLPFTVYGGPYKDRPPHLLGVKMAAEIPLPCAVDIPTEDFSIPTVQDMKDGLSSALRQMATGGELYVGCHGGIGRTGMFMACLQKVAQCSPRLPWFHGYFWEEIDNSGDEAILHVRSTYKYSAIETDEQEQFVRDFDAMEIAKAVYTQFH